MNIIGIKYRDTIENLIRMNPIIPKIQRDEIDEHTKEIIDYQLSIFKKYQTFFFMGCIELCQFQNQFYIVDGQHRFSCMKYLYEHFKNNFIVDFEIIQCEDLEEVYNWFHIANINRPIPDFLQEKTNSSEYNFLFVLKEYIKAQFPKYLSNSQKPQKPNIHIDLFLEELSKTIDFNQFKNKEEMIQWFEKENYDHGLKLESIKNHREIVKNIFYRIHQKETTNNFYLGTFYFENIPNKLSNGLRKRVWTNWFMSLSNREKKFGSPLCPICKIQNIDSFNFEAAHKISFINGGSDLIDNLIPACSSCNKSIGRMNIDDYLQKYHLPNLL